MINSALPRRIKWYRNGGNIIFSMPKTKLSPAAVEEIKKAFSEMKSGTILIDSSKEFNYITADDMIMANMRMGLRGACATRGMVNLNKDMSNICDNNQCGFCNTVRRVKRKLS